MPAAIAAEPAESRCSAGSVRFPMNVIEEIKARLARYPDLDYDATTKCIRVRPRNDDGFSVTLYVRGSQFRVSFEGWHETFEDAGEALDCFVFGLSDACRLEIEYRGGMATKWAVQSRRGAAWVTDSEVGLLVVPFWRPRRVAHRQNHVVPAG
jgi:hypothetical protein